MTDQTHAHEPGTLGEYLHEKQLPGVPCLQPRWCFYIPLEGETPHGYIPSVVEENVAGHSPLMGSGEHSQPWYWGTTYEQAQEVCAKANAEQGLTPEDCTAIVASSIGASIREDARRQELADRYEGLRRNR